MDILNDRTVKARKNHRCILCDLRIPASTVHRVYSVADYGDIWRCREHLECTKAAHEDKYQYWDEPDGYSFREEYADKIDFDKISGMNKS